MVFKLFFYSLLFSFYLNFSCDLSVIYSKMAYLEWEFVYLGVKMLLAMVGFQLLVITSCLHLGARHVLPLLSTLGLP